MTPTPMVRQYLEVKKQYPDCFLFFRLGDFYELFFDDAKKAADLLEITLTARGTTAENRVPMCGVPYHAAQGYINRLTQLGFKVAICEQTENPAEAKGIVRREVIRVIGPGTNLEDDTVPMTHGQYLGAVSERNGRFGFSYLDLATGEFKVTQPATGEDLLNLLVLVAPRELITTEALLASRALTRYLAQAGNVAVKTYEAWIFDRAYGEGLLKECFSLFSLEGIGLNQLAPGVESAGALLHYLRDNLFRNFAHLKLPEPVEQLDYLLLDRHTLHHLEVFPQENSRQKNTSLFEILNKTKTTMGARLLSAWLRQPLVGLEKIQQRHALVAAFLNPDAWRDALRGCLREMRDLEKILGRLTCGVANPRDLLALRLSFATLPKIRALLENETADASVAPLASQIRTFPELLSQLEAAITDEPPATLKDGGFIRPGFSKELDEYLEISKGGRQWMAAFQQQEIERTGIKSLKIRFNKVFGYYIEITKSNLDMVPPDYERKQTLVNAERFTRPELKEYERKIIGADEASQKLEMALFETLRLEILSNSRQIQETAKAVATLDVLLGFAQLAKEANYTCPSMSDAYTLQLHDSRHPVVEQNLPKNRFIPNDLFFELERQEMLLITGPNMAGKSTYLRQCALLVLMAQAGSFVPAANAQIGIVDKIFTRIGASDNLARGESTFMVEMIETANILHHATHRSLVIMDEVGRGTSTYDGVSIAWAICEYFAQKNPSPRLLFATHYHELAVLEQEYPKLRNFNATVHEDKKGIVFLHKIKPGAADKSYGIHVAELAGLPKSVTQRAKEILLSMEKKSSLAAPEDPRPSKSFDTSSLPLFSQREAPKWHPILTKLQELELNNLSPLEALNLLASLQHDLNTENPVSENLRRP